VRRELAIDSDKKARALPSRVHAIVLVSKLHKPTLRALAYARASRPSVIEALTVRVDAEESERLQQEWEARNLPVPLRVLDSPYREVTRPVVEYVRGVRRDSPRDLVVVFVPEYVVGHWWEQLLHNQSALRLKSRLHYTPGVMVASVPWQLASSEGLEDREDGLAPGRGRLVRGHDEPAPLRTPLPAPGGDEPADGPADGHGQPPEAAGVAPGAGDSSGAG
jgi:hypothetical protein